jgi:hypothetical protein
VTVPFALDVEAAGGCPAEPPVPVCWAETPAFVEWDAEVVPELEECPQPARMISRAVDPAGRRARLPETAGRAVSKRLANESSEPLALALHAHAVSLLIADLLAGAPRTACQERASMPRHTASWQDLRAERTRSSVSFRTQHGSCAQRQPLAPRTRAVGLANSA